MLKLTSKVSRTMKSRGVALGAAVMIALGAMSSGVAEAQIRPVTGNDRTLNGSQVSADERMTLEVRKKGFNPFDDPVPGALPPGDLTGVTFVLYLAPDFDVTTDVGRDEASRARSKEEWDAIYRYEVAREKTDGRRVATFTDLKPGLYLLEEIRPDTEHNYLTSSPRWVVLPVADAMGEEFEHENIVVVKPAPISTPPPVVPPTTTTPSTTTTGAPPPNKTPTTSSSPVPGQPPEEPFEDGPRLPRGVGASTGANVVLSIIAGLILLGLGVFMSKRKKRS